MESCHFQKHVCVEATVTLKQISYDETYMYNLEMLIPYQLKADWGLPEVGDSGTVTEDKNDDQVLSYS